MIFSNLNKFLDEIPKFQLNSNELKKLDQAFEYSLQSKPRYKLASFIVVRNRIISKGTNQVKTHPIQHRWNFITTHIHVEIDALIRLYKTENSIDFSKATIFVARSGRKTNEKKLCSYPCKSCLAALLHTGIKNIVCCDTSGNPVKIIL